MLFVIRTKNGKRIQSLHKLPHSVKNVREGYIVNTERIVVNTTSLNTLAKVREIKQLRHETMTIVVYAWSQCREKSSVTISGVQARNEDSSQ